ncbi:MAG: AI-2E family transporter [Gammaproteobacteria bacterium]|nr:AI-2E family transporter [Gammaproteobacteria bacterium]
MSDQTVDMFVRLGVVLLLVVCSVLILTPFVPVLLWAIIIAVSAYPAYRWLAEKLGGRDSWAATLLVLIILVFLIAPIAASLPSFASSVRSLAADLQTGRISVPDPADQLKTWPLVGEQLFNLWEQAATNVTDVLSQFRPQLQSAGLSLLGSVAAVVLAVLQFIASAIIAGVMLSHHERLIDLADKLFHKVAPASSGRFITLTERTVRGVTMGVIGVAIVQAILAGIGFAVMGIPAAVFWAFLCLILAVLQISIVLVVLPVVIYSFYAFELLPVLLFVAWNVPILALDNVLKPILMGRGVDTPMLIIFIGAIGGFLSFGFLGLFFGAVVLVIAYDLFVVWLEDTTPQAPN